MDDKLKSAVEQLNKTFGAGTISPKHPPAIEAVSTGSLIMDRALGTGGYPKGKIIELFGDESSGKSTWALHFLSQFDGPTVYIDTENSFDEEYARQLGVNTDNMIVSQPDTIEIGLEVVKELCDKCEALVFDSIAEAPTKKELEGDLSDADIGVKAKLMSKAMRVIKPIKNRGTMIFINQVRENPGIMFGSNRVTPAGRAMKFAAHVRIDLRRGPQIKHGEEVIGHYIVANLVKNKLGRPFSKSNIPLIYNGYGISREHEVLDMGIEAGVIKKGGSWYKYGEVSLGQGIVGARLFLEDNPEICNEILSEIDSENTNY